MFKQHVKNNDIYQQHGSFVFKQQIPILIRNFFLPKVKLQPNFHCRVGQWWNSRFFLFLYFFYFGSLFSFFHFGINRIKEEKGKAWVMQSLMSLIHQPYDIWIFCFSTSKEINVPLNGNEEYPKFKWTIIHI